jgi:microsomal dipeptidase-like Zn-dependent dipeptidase
VGSDFGGIVEGPLPDLADVGRIGLLFDEMSARGLPEELADAVASANAARALRASLSKRPE